MQCKKIHQKSSRVLRSHYKRCSLNLVLPFDVFWIAVWSVGQKGPIRGERFAFPRFFTLISKNCGKSAFFAYFR